eukprot:TRINITY_DN1561_c0_g2_i1.p1 TRINITY_DN1561_c0_g2~~TRINITY_DN1561_c0_g2_i1.p1  ORF type:complete len:588 (-),score=69.79 TRINITY_DN1561_c0_g2_i1:1412-3175(-)
MPDGSRSRPDNDILAGLPRTESENALTDICLPYPVDNHGHYMATPLEKENSIMGNPLFLRGYIAGAATMCLGILGGGILPVAWAFSITGVAAGVAMAGTVAWANVFTSDLLIRQCFKTGTSDYEELALATGGPLLLFAARVSILVLQFGAIIGGFEQTAESAVMGLQTIWGDEVPGWVTYKDGNGYVPMLVLATLIGFPLCMVRQMRSLEYVGMAGFFIVVSLVVVVVVSSIAAGLPAIGNGETQALGFDSPGNLAQAAAIFGFVFYNQPVMMPLLAEMPGDIRHRARILSWAQRFTVAGFCFAAVFLVGFFGAAWLGNSTQGNILQNTILGGGVPQGVLNLMFALYLSFVVPPLEIPAKTIVSNWLPGNKHARPHLRHLLVTTGILGFCLAVAIGYPDGSANLLVITGATGVFMAAYAMPVGIHFLLYFGVARCQHEANRAYRSVLERSAGRRSEASVSESSFIRDNVQKSDSDSSRGTLQSRLLPFHDTNASDLSVHSRSEPPKPFIAGSLVEVVVRQGEGVITREASWQADLWLPGVLTYRRKIRPGLWPVVYEVCMEIVLPICIVCLGMVTSAASLWATFGNN